MSELNNPPSQTETSGWKLVPIEPSLVMVMAGEEAYDRGLDARLNANPRRPYPSEEQVELASRVAYRAMINAAPQTAGWTKVTPDMPFEVLKSITIDNQVLAYENGRYFNAWLIFDEYEGGWCWVDDDGSEPSPSHYRPLLEVALAASEGKP